MIDILAIGAHPDDIEIFMGGAMLFFNKKGLKTGICDLTRGEAGTYGSAETRTEELKKASEILNVTIRETLSFPDGNIQNTNETKLKVIDTIRKHKPELIFTFLPAPQRHPDHNKTGEIVQECMFLSGLAKIKTENPAFRPSSLINFPELIPTEKPDFIIDITNEFEEKVKAIRAYSSQVTAKGENDNNAKTFLRSNRFWEILKARAIMAGALIGVKYGEPFYSKQPINMQDIFSAFVKKG